MDWISFTLIAVVSLGVSMALYKMPAFKGYSSFHSTFWTNIFAFCFSIPVFFLFSGEEKLLSISWLGLLWGVFFALTMVQQKMLLKRMETSTLLPVTSSLGNVATVVLGVLLFSEHVSLYQSLAIAIIFISVFLYSRKKGGLILDTNSISLGLGIIVASTLTKVIQKYGATHETVVHFSVYQAVGAVLCALTLIYLFERNTFPQLLKIKSTWKMFFLTAIFSSIGGYALLFALQSGPLSGVYAIHPSYIVVTALLGVILYKEKLTPYKIGLMALTIFGIILIKLG